MFVHLAASRTSSSDCILVTYFIIRSSSSPPTQEQSKPEVNLDEAGTYVRTSRLLLYGGVFRYPAGIFSIGHHSTYACIVVALSTYLEQRVAGAARGRPPERKAELGSIKDLKNAT